MKTRNFEANVLEAGGVDKEGNSIVGLGSGSGLGVLCREQARLMTCLRVRTTYSAFVTKVSVPLDQLDPALEETNRLTVLNADPCSYARVSRVCFGTRVTVEISDRFLDARARVRKL